ncbi:transcriptional regulation of mitochondrial recombination-domain-containing protein [Echria macrotheca]|uniref:Large ribosomal subunit protein mL67 n=1 Tax=Echria macrotheca TaxID=438768 RepID=A0AAJ0BDC4_9PEZI|nr:transcriptional regulation of mitochondrial recombination-domain-containing protein [Echria macrotheca]
MNTLYTSPICRLALGVTRAAGMRHSTPIRIRCIQSTATPRQTAAATTTTTSTADEAAPPPTKIKPQGNENPIAERPNSHPEGHGEQIWVHSHMYDGHVMYSFKRAVDSNKGHRQLPYTGKKLVPAKMRRDYWRPMAIVSFGEGMGNVGRNVYQKLVEFKRRHELEWSSDTEEVRRMEKMDKRERGRRINDQRANAVADMAAVLAGTGKGNKMWMVDWEAVMGRGEEVWVRRKNSSSSGIWTRVVEGGPERLRLERLGVRVERAADKKFLDWARVQEVAVEVRRAGGGEKVEGGAGLVPSLHGATVYWANEQDRFWAREWSENVGHVLGLEEFDYVKEAEEVEESGMPVAA